MLSPLTIFLRFLVLGCVCFGGPIAHVGYFEREFVTRLQWIGRQRFTDLLALAQILPGPASSQLGFAVGYEKGGLAGALAAFAGFTLPSFLIMYSIAVYGESLLDADLYDRLVYGLKLLAVVVVADAVINMAARFCYSPVRAGLAVLTVAVIFLVNVFYVQYLCLGVAALAGMGLLQSEVRAPVASGQGFRHGYLLAFFILLAAFFALAAFNDTARIINGFYQAGSFVFGGGHVVLPLLQNFFGDQMDADRFLTGYAAAQAIPGPMFTIATYLGPVLLPQAPLAAALVCTLAIFTPGFLLLLGLHRNLDYLRGNRLIQAAFHGVNAAVVGLLAAAFYDPVFTSIVHTGRELLLVVIGLVIARTLKPNVMFLVAAYAAIGLLYG